MKAVRIFAALLGVAMLAGGAAAQDNYERLARELTEAGASLENKKIAIIPFAHADGRAVTKDGAVVSERLTIKMINTRKFEIIERSVLDKVMDELKLQNTGAIDATSAKELGKVLGVEAIITGTLVETSSGKIEVNARLIKTETAQAIGASQVTVEKDWIGDAPTQMPAQQQAQQPQVYQPQQAAKPAAPRQRHPNEYGYFDIFLGGGSRNIDITYENTNANLSSAWLGISAPSFTGAREVKLEQAEGSGVGPIGMRVGGFGKGAIGGAFEFSANSHIVEPQTVSGTRNGLTSTFVLSPTANHLEMTSFGFVGNLFVRHAGKTVDPYFGIGLGLSLNRVYMPTVTGYTGTTSSPTRPVDQMGVGLIFNMPIGVRIKLDPKTQIVAEMRYELNSVSFDRDIAGESDSINSDGVRFLVGMGFGF
ncbi:MAG: FlgO family outer membrane protein [Elusimicrobiales bacterium]|nr:FlgO family outer membrane protein [Elusimicrobiales bacterium]